MLHLVGRISVEIAGVRLALAGLIAQPFGVDQSLVSLRLRLGRLNFRFAGTQFSFLGLHTHIGRPLLILGALGAFVFLPAFADEEKNQP